MIDHINSTFHRLHGKRDVVIYTSDGIAIFYLFRGGLDMHLTEKDRPVLLKGEFVRYSLVRGLISTCSRPPARRANNKLTRPPPSSDHILTSLARRNFIHPPGKPPSGDNRHYNWEATLEACQAANPKQACGVHYYGCWSPIGHSHVIPTSHTLGYIVRATDHVPEMYKDLGPMLGGLGLIFSVVDPAQYRMWVV
jgi:hypothetical protein